MSRLRAAIFVLVALAAAIPAGAARSFLDDPTGVVLLIDAVEQVLDDSSVLLTSQVVVETDAATRFIGCAAVTDLRPGDLLQVEGEWMGDLLMASSLLLLQGPSSPVALSGVIAYLIPEPPSFVLSDGTLAQVHPGTVYVGVDGFADLNPGDSVIAEGSFEPWTPSLLVDRLERLDGPAQGTYLAFPGVVAEVASDDRVELVDGTVLLVGPATALWGFDAVTDLAERDTLWIEAVTTVEPGVLDALTLSLQVEPPITTGFQATVATVDPTGSFTTVEGELVVVDAATVWIGLAGLSELRPDDMVWIEGEADADLSALRASLVQLLGGREDGDAGGLRSRLQGPVEALLPPDGFTVVGVPVATDSSTSWLGTLTGYDDLAEGTVVDVELLWQPGGDLLALSVEGLAAADIGLIPVSGTVTVADAAAGRYQLDGAAWVSIETGTPIDGDVDALEEIATGMMLSADCVVLGEQEYLALWVFVTDGELYLPVDEPGVTEALVVVAPSASAETVATRYGASVSGSLPGTLVHLFTWVEAVSETDIRMLAEDPEVEDVEVNYRFSDPEAIRRRMPTVDRNPSSKRYREQDAAAEVGLPDAHARSAGEGTVVAVLDNGVDPLHPVLRRQLAAGGWDFVDGDDEPWETADGIDQDGDGVADEAAGHGTFVAGMVLLAAPRAAIVPYRVLDSDGNGTTFAICQAVLAAIDRGADVINMSLAYATRSQVLDRILDEASARGVILVTGAGNEGQGELPFPARDHRVIAVAAVDAQRELAAFSNYGPGVTLAAPGVGVYSSLDEQRFGTWSGTSMAAPLVSGAAALLRSVDPYLTPEQVRDALVQSAAPLAGDPRDVAGVVQVDAALDLIPGRQ